MSRKQLILLTKIDPKLIEFRLPKEKAQTGSDSKKNGVFFSMFYPDKNGNMSPFNIQFPKLIAPFGMSEYESNYSIALEIPLESKAFKVLKQIEDLTLEFVTKNAAFFYKSPKEQKNASAYFKEFLKSSNPDYSPTLSVKLKNKPNSEEFDAKADIITEIDGENITETNQVLTVDSCNDHITKRSEIVAVVNVYGYQVDTKFGLSFKTTNLRIFSVPEDTETFLEDEDEVDDEDEVPDDETEGIAEGADVPVDPFDADDLHEEYGADETDEPQAPVKPKRKKK